MQREYKMMVKGFVASPSPEECADYQSDEQKGALVKEESRQHFGIALILCLIASSLRLRSWTASSSVRGETAGALPVILATAFLSRPSNVLTRPRPRDMFFPYG